MKKTLTFLMMTVFTLTIFSCAAQPDRYNTQSGAAIGAGIGALAGQAIGHGVRSTLLGAGLGMALGGIIGNGIDQSYQAQRDYNRGYYSGPYYPAPTVYRTVYQPVVPVKPVNCRKVVRRVWEGGSLVTERVEEICESYRYPGEY